MHGIWCQSLIIILGLHSFTSSESISPVFHTITKTWTKEYFTDFSFDQRILRKDGRFLYMYCSVHGVGARDLKFDCEVNVEISLLRPAVVNKSDRCSITFDAGREEKFSFEPQDITINSLDTNQVLINWPEKVNPAHADGLYYGKVRLLNMTDCSFKEFKYPYNKRTSNGVKFDVAVYSQGFEVFISNVTSCSGLHQCRISFNSKIGFNGTIVPFTTKLNNPSIVPVSISTPSRGFYVLGFSSSNAKMFGLSHVNSTGSEKMLTDFTYYKNNLEYSDTYDLFSCCWISLNKLAGCVQFGNDLTIRVNKTFQLEGDTEILSVHNLKDGGVLILTSQMEILDAFNVKYRIRVGDHITAFKISKDNVLTKLYEMPIFDFECNNDGNYELSVSYLEDKNETCFYFACVQGHYDSPSSDLSIGKRCKVA
ncbi:hypothetical protein QAD02_006165 [Eretmocerus hayati]|uniref:Uncharacterized protein n=1 Tax=Eretmocerus hayati TaxID=131215 RepID=A0ACC2N175_9HYME|nr:hypothetical protein QAD02_006165 [Eretmocerus hayati]